MTPLSHAIINRHRDAAKLLHDKGAHRGPGETVKIIDIVATGPRRTKIRRPPPKIEADIIPKQAPKQEPKKRGSYFDKLKKKFSDTQYIPKIPNEAPSSSITSVTEIRRAGNAETKHEVRTSKYRPESRSQESTSSDTQVDQSNDQQLRQAQNIRSQLQNLQGHQPSSAKAILLQDAQAPKLQEIGVKEGRPRQFRKTLRDVSLEPASLRPSRFASPNVPRQVVFD